jgi:hypothetical protein
MDGAIGYSGQGSLQGGLSFHDAVVTVPDSPPVRFEQAHIIFGNGHVRLSPALVRGGDNDEARIDADWALDDAALDLEISTDGMKVQSLRAQVALANVPGLEQVTSGAWSGGLRFHRDAAGYGWSGRIALIDAAIPMAGFSAPLLLVGSLTALVPVDDTDRTQRVVVDPGAAFPPATDERVATLVVSSAGQMLGEVPLIVPVVPPPPQTAGPWWLRAGDAVAGAVADAVRAVAA